MRANWRQYLYFCSGKARKLSTCGEGGGDVRANWRKPCRERQAHKPLHAGTIRQPYVSIRQHTSEYLCRERGNKPLHAGTIRQHTSAYISIRQNKSEYLRRERHTNRWSASRCSVYLLYWYKSTNTEAAHKLEKAAYRDTHTQTAACGYHTSAYVSIHQHTSE